MASPSSQTVFFVLADESANWKVAGLRQLERVLLSLNEWAGATNQAQIIDVVVIWRPEIPLAARWLPERQRTPRLRLTESIAAVDGPARILTTRLLVERNRLGEFLESAKPVYASGNVNDAWSRLSTEFEAAQPAKGGGWRFLRNPRDAGAGTRHLVRGSVKSQDGVVSRFLNRPISRLVTRVLLRYPITPTAWTLAIGILPLISFALFLQGEYLSIVWGAGLFQLFSILDGCDGEIARARYLESRRGGRIDYLCDLFANILYVVGLGMGLSRAPGSSASTYFLEGILCGAFMVVNEILLWRGPRQTSVASDPPAGKFYARHHGMIQHSGLNFFGEKFVGWLFQLTKRDVSVLAFFCLALAGWPQWILHLWFAVTLGSAILAGTAALRSRGGKDLSAGS